MEANRPSAQHAPEIGERGGSISQSVVPHLRQKETPMWAIGCSIRYDTVRPLDGRVAKIKHLGYGLALIAVCGASCATGFSAHADSRSDRTQQNFSDEGSADNQLLQEI